MSTGVPSFSSMYFSPTAPTAAAGTDESTSSHARRPSRVDGLLTLDDQPHAFAHVDHEVVAEVADDGDQRAEVQRHVERLLDRRVTGEVVPAEQPRHQQQVPAGGDGQELGEPLHEAEHDGVEDGHGGQFYSLGRLGMMRGFHGRCSSQWCPTMRPSRSLARKSAGTVEVGHLDVRTAERQRHVRVAARTGGEIELVGERGGALVEAAQAGLRVQALRPRRRGRRAPVRRAPARPCCVASGRTDAGCRRRRPDRGWRCAASAGGVPGAMRSVRNSPMISPACVFSSSPTMTRHGSRFANSAAPRTALWSVMHSTSSPASTTASSISSGVVVLSPLHIVWLCRSTRTQPAGNGCARCG